MIFQQITEVIKRIFLRNNSLGLGLYCSAAGILTRCLIFSGLVKTRKNWLLMLLPSFQAFFLSFLFFLKHLSFKLKHSLQRFLPLPWWSMAVNSASDGTNWVVKSCFNKKGKWFLKLTVAGYFSLRFILFLGPDILLNSLGSVIPFSPLRSQGKAQHPRRKILLLGGRGGP